MKKKTYNYRITAYGTCIIRGAKKRSQAIPVIIKDGFSSVYITESVSDGYLYVSYRARKPFHMFTHSQAELYAEKFLNKTSEETNVKEAILETAKGRAIVGFRKSGSNKWTVIR